MTSQQFLVCDNSNVTNFKQWGQAISLFFAAAGWVQTSDTGQVNWTTISSVPGSGAYVYEIWRPGDALTTFYLKMEYGNSSGTNSPGMRVSIGMGTNGSGTLTGIASSAWNTVVGGIAPPSTTTQYECDFSGSNNRICIMMWRNAPNNVQQLIAVERSLDASGAYTGAYVTWWVGGMVTGSGAGNNFGQESLVFGVGLAPASINGGTVGSLGGLVVRRMQVSQSGNTTAFNNGIPFDLAAPAIGYFDYACTSVGSGWGADFAEGVTFTATIYGVLHTYMPSKAGPFANAGPNNSGGSVLCMRYD